MAVSRDEWRHRNLHAESRVRIRRARKYEAIGDTARTIRSILELRPMDCYGGIDIDAMHRSEPYRLMMAEIDRAAVKKRME